MKKLIQDQAIYETLLYLYFSDKKDIFLGVPIIQALEKFIRFYEIEDEFNNTNNVATLKKLYEDNEYSSRESMLKQMALSETGLYRFRIKVIERLEKHLNSCEFLDRETNKF